MEGIDDRELRISDCGKKVGRMTTEECSRLDSLDAVLRSENVRKQIRPNVLVSNPDAPMECRWISIPRNVWHRPVVGAEADWVVVSFHTVTAEELIEERPDIRTSDRTKQMRYLEQK